MLLDAGVNALPPLNWTPPEDRGVGTELGYFGKSPSFFNLNPNGFVFIFFKKNPTCDLI